MPRSVLAVLALATAPLVVCAPAPPPTGALRTLGDDAVEVEAKVNARGFGAGGMAGYHAVVWEEGGAADAALFQAAATDLEVLDALEALGGVPGDGLTMAAWEHRHDRDDPAADATILGPPVEVLLRIPGRPDLVPLADVLEDPGGRGLALRLGGHRALVPEWHSGCVVCLYSCPGSKVGNAAYTIRDYVDGATAFRVRPGVLPADGTQVGLVFRLVGALR